MKTATKATLYAHQKQTIELLQREENVLDLSDPGTGKTLSALTAFAARRANGAGPALVFAPKSILAPTWADHVTTFFPQLTYAIAGAANRASAFALDVDVYITNHDAVTWVAKNWAKLEQFHDSNATLIVDESTAYKNPQAQRSKAIKKVSSNFTYRECMSGTPTPNTILEIWHQAYICDQGERLGHSFYGFRSAVCEPKQVGPRADMIQWVDKDGAHEAVTDLLSDIVIRHKFEECISIPPNVQRSITFDLSPEHRRIYDTMRKEALLLLDDDTQIEAVHAASLATKLLQIASGAVYTGIDNKYAVIDDTRTELVMDLVEARTHSLVAFLWKHQRNALVQAAENRGLSYAVIDGDATDNERTAAVSDFQAGKLRVIFAHPKSAGHGLTLTKGIATIWASPTYLSEAYKQFLHRIYRSGQTLPTETIHVLARGTIDELAFNRLDGKLTAMQLLLDLVEKNHANPAPAP